MTTSQIASLVRLWFDQAEQVNGPVLPDGWFGGRPYENAFVLMDVQASDDAIVVHLSEDTTLRITRPQRAYVKNSELVFDNFDHATLCWKDYGGTHYNQKQYDSGQIRFMPPIGTIIAVS